jgi:hypothetical protein
LRAADNSQYIDLILLKAINYAIGLFDHFADIFSLVLGYLTTGKWFGGDLFGAAVDIKSKICKLFDSVKFGMKSNIQICA